MQKMLLFGKADKLVPWLDGCESQSDGSLSFTMSGVNKLQIKEDQDITWNNLLYSELHNFVTRPDEEYELNALRDKHPLAIYNKYIESLWDKLEQYCNSTSTAERDFFNLYCELCLYDNTGGAILPALIPNVYVNWLFSKEERAKSKKPFLVDFIFKSSRFGTNNIVIIEIDGPSHYATYNQNHKKYELSEEVYAEHLMRDRWLRHQGFKVFRIGNSEIKKIAASPERDRIRQFYCFLNEIFGKVFWIEI
jgi:very-short-patch-repair endonuclease